MSTWGRIFRVDRFVVVQNCLLFFYFISLITGFSIQANSGTVKKPKVSRILVVYNISLAIILGICYRSASELLTVGGKRSPVTVVVDGIESMLLLQSMIFGTIRRYRSWNQLVEIYNEFRKISHEIGYSLREICRPVNEKVLQKLLSSIALLVVIVVAVLWRKIMVENVPLDFFTILSSVYPKVMIVYVTVWFYLNVLYVQRFLELLNSKLEALHRNVAEAIASKKYSERHIQKLHQIMILRSRVVNLACRINQAYGYTMMMVYTLIAMLNLSQLYYLFITIYRYVRYSSDPYERLSISILFMCILNFYELYCVADVSEMCVEQSNKTSEILQRFNGLNMDARLQQSMEIFLIQLMHHPIKFTACGMFTLDYSMLFSIITSATSYLIILIQFELANSSSCSKITQ
ncbi:putative gustatory receptor 28b [Toxorhynchites rutilus septentrionalis]|uniref:putative gustatory receptor 28b n=1 Tax=Toxorhynchites rutilus septentrionalis TaxID=329112 RepID=UPI002478AC8C|nr:putative gustatory receptor 28b [Toxorhynchites rutilus septentrionalis]